MKITLFLLVANKQGPGTRKYANAFNLQNTRIALHRWQVAGRETDISPHR